MHLLYPSIQVIFVDYVLLFMSCIILSHSLSTCHRWSGYRDCTVYSHFRYRNCWLHCFQFL